jgi:hypothetical protein
MKREKPKGKRGIYGAPYFEPRVPFLGTTLLKGFVRYASKRPEYHDIQILFARIEPQYRSVESVEKGIDLLDVRLIGLFQHSLHFVIEEKLKLTPVDRKLELATGYSKVRIRGVASRLRSLASAIDELNELKLPGGEMWITLLETRGREDLGWLPGVKGTARLASQFKRLPGNMTAYAKALKEWPHPDYRKRYSDRNWQTRRLAQLCALVQAIHDGEKRFEEIASLLTLANAFVAQTPSLAEYIVPVSSRARLKLSGVVVDAELVRKNLANFKKRLPKDWEVMERGATSFIEKNRPIK